MGLTGSVHPPAGATALLAVTDDGVARLGWGLVPVVLVGCALMLLVALLVNNVQRTFPASWWTTAAEEEGVGSFWTGGMRNASDAEAGVGAGARAGARAVGSADGGDKMGVAVGSDGAQPGSATGSVDSELGEQHVPDEQEFLLITMSRRGMSIPPTVHLTGEERLCLQEICRRL